MGELLMPGVLLTPLKIIPLETGDVMHGMTLHSPGFSGFGEAYFSWAQKGPVKGWKRHRQMVLNLVVPIGAIKFVLYDGREEMPTYQQFFTVIMSPQNYQRLTIPPMIWNGFAGVGESHNMLLNLASIPHDPQEADRLDLHEIPYPW